MDNTELMSYAKAFSGLSGCMRRNVGALIVDCLGNHVGMGYNAPPRGIESCKHTGECLRMKSKPGKDLDRCYAIHAEIRAILDAFSKGVNLGGSTLYVTTFPCLNCMKIIAEVGITTIYFLDDYPSEMSYRIAQDAGIKLVKIHE